MRKRIGSGAPWHASDEGSRPTLDEAVALALHIPHTARVSVLGLPRNRPLDRAPMTCGRQWRLKHYRFVQAAERVAKGAAP